MIFNFFITIFVALFTLSSAAEDLVKLYEELIDLNLRIAYPAQAEKSFKVHLLDSYKKFPDFNKIRAENLIPLAEKNLFEGTMAYISVFKKKYKYNVLLNNEKIVFNVKVFFKNSTPKEDIYFKQKILQASSIWNDSKPKFNFNYSFVFESTKDQSKANYKIELRDDTRGPYDTFWNRKWNQFTIAHEIGHMMGLGDEYETATSELDCLESSLMCSSQSGKLLLHHYYFILRRLIKDESIRL